MSRWQKNHRKRLQKKLPNETSIRMTQKQEHTSRFSIMRFMLRMTQVIAVCLVLADLAFMSGVLERRIIPFLSEQVLGVRVSLWIDGWSPLYVRGLCVQEGDAAP